MKILVTGARGFIGKNLISTLWNIKEGKDKSFGLTDDLEIDEYDADSDPELLSQYCKDCDFVFNLAGVNRPEKEEDFMAGNFGFAEVLLETLKRAGNKCPVMLSSSIQAALDNPYGKSKKAGEELFFEYGKECGAEIFVYRFPNVFGKWCRPNYNSAVATFCNNIANDLPIKVNDGSVDMNLIYIDDLVSELIAALTGKANKREDGYYYVEPVHKIKLGEIVDLLYYFRDSRKNLSVPDMSEDSFSKKLYATYLSYLPANRFSYPLKMNVDDRGSFTEILRTAGSGQFSVNISKPGITKGNHWHHTKNEKFVVVHGHGMIQLRKVGTDENGQPYPVVNYEVSGEEITVVDMIPGYTHNIINLSETEDLVTFMWANECFDSNKPDTYYLQVEDK